MNPTQIAVATSLSRNRHNSPHITNNVEIGWALIIFVLLLTYIIFIVWLSIYVFDNMAILAIGFLSPLFLLGLYLIL